MFDYKNILIFAAHQDDETIGCGASIRKWANCGHNVEVAFVTNGATGIDHNDKYTSATIINVRQEESLEAAKILGINKIYNFNVGCQQVEYSKELFHNIITLLRERKPDLVITHSELDKHGDHRNTSKIVKEACWKASEAILPELGAVHKVKDLWAFEITDPLPEVDYIMDVTEVFEDKMRAMKVYNSQHDIVSGIENYLDGISRVRGYDIGKLRGEAFKRISMCAVEII